MRFPTGTEVQRLRSGERNFSRIYLGVQKGKERGDFTSGTLMVGQHLRLTVVDGYVANEHLLYFGSASLAGTDIRPNMTLCVGTATDPTAYGTVRIRAIGLNAAPTGDDGLYLEPNELRTLGYLQPGDYIWVDGIYRLYRKLPHIDGGTVYEDGNGNSGGGAGIPGYGIGWAAGYRDRPVALMGSPRFAWTGESLDFYGWRSHGRGGHGIQNWLWDFDGGTCLGPGIGYPSSPGHPVHARWDSAGEYIVSLTVEDTSGRNTNDAYGVPFDRHTAVRPVLVYDRPGGDNPPYMNFEVESLGGKYGSGWSASITVFDTADKSEFPDNALIIIYTEDWYNEEQGSIGGWYGQENILFVGHIRANSVVADFEKSTVSFEAQTIEQWMKDIGVWPANFVSTTAAESKWHEFDNMTIEDILWYLAEMRSNLKDVTDCFFASDVNAEKQVNFLDLTEASLYDQMSEQIGSCFFGKISASRHGSIHLFKHKNMMDVGERAWWGPPVYSFSAQDWRDEIQIGEERQRDSVAQVDLIGFYYDLNGDPQEVWSLAPARQTNFGKIEKVTGILLSNPVATALTECATLAGLYLAWKNIRFPNITVPTRVNNRVLEPATLDYFAVVLAADDTERGYVWSGKEFLTTGVSMRFDHEKGIIQTDVEGEASTWGPDGISGLYPDDPPASNPPNDNPSEYWPSIWPPPIGEEPGDPPPWAEFADADEDEYFPIMAYMGLGSGQVIRGTGLGRGFGYSCEYHNCGLVHTDGVVWIALDEFNPENRAMVCTDYRIFRTTNLSDDNPDWELVLGPLAAGTFCMVRSSCVQEGLWMIMAFINPDVHVWWSINGGFDWDTTNFTSGNAGAIFPLFLEMSSHDPNVAWAMWIDSTDNLTYIAETDDMWATETITALPSGCFSGNPTFGRPCCHHRSYDNADDSEVLYGGKVVNGNEYARLYQNLTCTTLYTDAGASGDLEVTQVGCGVRSRDRWWALAQDDDACGFWMIDDTETWIEEARWAWGGPGANWVSRDCENLRGSSEWYIMTYDGTSYPLRISVDGGSGWYPQFGNWPAFVADHGLGDPNVLCVAHVFEAR